MRNILNLIKIYAKYSQKNETKFIYHGEYFLHRNALIKGKNGAKKKQVETTRKNKQFDISYYTDAVGIWGQPFTFSIFSRSVLFGEVDTVKCVSAQFDWTLSGFNGSFLDFIRFIDEPVNWNEKTEREVKC
jgi:hypothetical protein